MTSIGLCNVHRVSYRISLGGGGTGGRGEGIWGHIKLEHGFEKVHP